MATYTTKNYSPLTREFVKVVSKLYPYQSAITRSRPRPLNSQFFKVQTRQFSLVSALSLAFLSKHFGSGNAIDHKEFVFSFIQSLIKFTCRASSDYSLADAFGANAWQDENWFVIDKGDLGFIGELTTEQFLIALILRWANLFEPDRRIRCQYWRSIPVFFQGQWWDKHSFLIYLLAINSPSFPSPNSFLV